MAVFILRMEARHNLDGRMDGWVAYTVKMDGGKEIYPSNGPLTGYGKDPLEAVSQLVNVHARVLDGYRQAGEKKK